MISEAVFRIKIIAIGLLLVCAIILPFSFLWFLGSLSDHYHPHISMILSISLVVVGLTAIILYIDTICGTNLVGSDTFPKVFWPACVALFISHGIFYSSLAASYVVPFDKIDESCKNNYYQEHPRPIVNLAYANLYMREVSNYINNFDTKRKESEYSVVDYCKDYSEYSKSISDSHTDYNDNKVNRLIFNKLYLEFFFKRWDIGQAEYNRLKSRADKDLESELTLSEAIK